VEETAGSLLLDRDSLAFSLVVVASQLRHGEAPGSSWHFSFHRPSDILELWIASLIASRQSEASAQVFRDSSGATFFRISGQTCRACSHTDLSRIQ